MKRQARRKQDLDYAAWDLLARGTDPRSLVIDLCRLGQTFTPAADWETLIEQVRQLPFEEDAASGVQWIARALSLIPAERQPDINALGFKCFESEGHHLDFFWMTGFDPVTEEEEECDYPLAHREAWASQVMTQLWELHGQWCREQVKAGRALPGSYGFTLREAYALTVIRRAGRELPRDTWLAQHGFRYLLFGVTGYVELEGAITRDGYLHCDAGEDDLEAWIAGLQQRYPAAG